MLTKLPETVYTPSVPGSPGSPAVPAVPSRRVCGSPTSNTPQRVCSWVRIWYPPGGGGVLIPPGTTETREGTENGVAYVDCFICRTETTSGSNTGFVTCTTIPGTPAIPAVPAVPGTPAVTTITPTFTWNAGANSAQELSGDLQLRFIQDPAVGVILGLTNNPDAVPDPTRISHGLMFFQTATGQPRVRVYEAGAAGPERPHLPAEVYRIQRFENTVTYWEGRTLIHTSRTPSVVDVRAASSIFATGDMVPTAVVQVPDV